MPVTTPSSTRAAKRQSRNGTGSGKPGGRFTQTLIGNRIRVNISPDLSIASYVQYDTDSKIVGTNTRLRWTFRPVGDLFIVYNHNVQYVLERWKLESNQLLVKVQYAWRY